jgi:hypothetical protein
MIDEMEERAAAPTREPWKRMLGGNDAARHCNFAMRS